MGGWLHSNLHVGQHGKFILSCAPPTLQGTLKSPHELIGGMSKKKTRLPTPHVPDVLRRSLMDENEWLTKSLLGCIENLQTCHYKVWGFSLLTEHFIRLKAMFCTNFWNMHCHIFWSKQWNNINCIVLCCCVVMDKVGLLLVQGSLANF